MKHSVLTLVAVLTFGFCAILPAAAQSPALHIYATENPAVMEQLAQTYTRMTQIPVRITQVKTCQVMALEDADLVLSRNIQPLKQAADQNLLLPVSAKSLTRNVPAPFRDPDNQWFGLSFRQDTMGQGLPFSLTGAAVMKSSDNRAEAVRFLKWLTGKSAQTILADGSNGYAVNLRFCPMTRKGNWADLSMITSPVLEKKTGKKLESAG